jgi:hypothetical protein
MLHSQHFCHFLNASWKSCSVIVFSTACNSASITSVVSKRRPFSFIFNQGNRKVARGQVRRVGWVRDDTHVIFGQKFPGEKGSVRRCVVVMQQLVLLSPKFGAKSAHFQALAVKCHSSMQNWLFHLPGRILCEQSASCQRKWWASSWLCLVVLNGCPTGPELSMPFKHPCTACAFFPERLSSHCQGHHLTFSKICTKFYAHLLSDPLWNRIRPDTQLQIKGCKKSAHHPTVWNFEIMPVLPPTIVTRYYNCCTDGSISPGNYGYHLVYVVHFALSNL